MIMQSKVHPDIHGSIFLDIPNDFGIQLGIQIIALEALPMASSFELCERNFVHKWAA